MDKLNNTFYSQAHPKILIYNRKRVANQIIYCFKKTSPNLKLKTCLLLDVGASNGAITYYLAKKVKLAIGIDPDKVAIKHGRKKLIASNLKLDTFDGISIPYRNNLFDLIVFRRTYGSTQTLPLLIKEIHRVLKPNGLVYFEGHNKLFPLESDYRLPFLPWLSPKLAKLILKALGHDRYYLGNYQTYWQLKKTFKRFSINEITYLIIKNPRLFHFIMLYRTSKFTKYIPLIILQLLEPFYPDFIWMLQKS